MKNIDRLISEQVLIWSKNEARALQNQEKIEEWPVITISREFGARGRSLAKELGRRTGFKVWDKELLSAIAEKAGADEKFLASLDEKRRKLIQDALYGSFLGSKISNTHYYRSLLHVVKTIGAHGKSIIVGRGSNHIIKSPTPLNVRVICPFDKRVAIISKSEGMSKKEAETLVKSRDAERQDFIQHYFKKDSSNPINYDLVINSGSFNVQELADLVLLAYGKLVGKPAPVLMK